MATCTSVAGGCPMVQKDRDCLVGFGLGSCFQRDIIVHTVHVGVSVRKDVVEKHSCSSASQFSLKDCG